LDNGFLKTKLYEKPTDKHMYLHKRSDHSKTVKKSIPYGLGVRVKRICDDKEDHQHTENKCEVCQKIAQVTVVPIHLSMY
jgi:hypothetical protein